MNPHFPQSYAKKFHELINQYAPVSDESFHDFINQFELVHFKKGEVLLREGEVCRHLYFILEGAVRCFRLDENGKEMNLHFYFEDELVSEFRSLRFEEPTERNLVAMTPTKALRSFKPDYIDVLQHNFDFTTAALRFFQELFLEEEAYSEMLRKLSADERYQYVLEHEPHMLQRISLTQLSSWLGISRESLSRIRGRIAS